jgi:hypothetical protein
MRGRLPGARRYGGGCQGGRGSCLLGRAGRLGLDGRAVTAGAALAAEFGLRLPRLGSALVRLVGSAMKLGQASRVTDC